MTHDKAEGKESKTSLREVETQREEQKELLWPWGTDIAYSTHMMVLFKCKNCCLNQTENRIYSIFKISHFSSSNNKMSIK